MTERHVELLERVVVTGLLVLILNAVLCIVANVIFTPPVPTRESCRVSVSISALPRPASYQRLDGENLK